MLARVTLALGAVYDESSRDPRARSNWRLLRGRSRPVLSASIVQHGTGRHSPLDRTIAQRQLLYSEFIKEASGLFAKSLTNPLEDLEGLIALSARVGRVHLPQFETKPETTGMRQVTSFRFHLTEQRAGPAYGRTASYRR